MAEEQEEAPKGKSKLMLIIIIAVVLLLGGGGAAFFLLGGEDEASAAPEGEMATQVTKPEEPIVYVNIPQPFIFNVTGDVRDRMVQIKVQLMVRGSQHEEEAQYHSPLIESTLLSTFATATVEQLRSTNGRIELRKRATDDVQAALAKVVGSPVIEKVLFTDFVIQ